MARYNLLELVNALNALGLLFAVDEAAEGRLELLTAGTVGHAAQAGAVPVDLSGLGVESTLLGGFLLEGLGRARLKFCGSHHWGLGCWLRRLLVGDLLNLGCYRGLGSLWWGWGRGMATLLLDEGVDGGEIGLGELGGGGLRLSCAGPE